MNRVFLSPKQIIEIHVTGDQSAETVEAMCQDVIGLMETLNKQDLPVFIIDNLKAMGETTPEARSVVAKYGKTIDFRRVAMVGDSSPMMRFGTNLMLRAIGKPNIKYFANLDAALDWFALDPDFAKLAKP